MKRYTNFSMVVTVCAGLVALGWTLPVHAQCATCPTQVVAFSPVVAPAATVTTFQPVRTGWYPGKLLDTWRMRRWGYTAPTTVTAAYAPTWSTAVPVTAAMPVTTMMPVTSTFVPQTVSYAPIATTSFSTPHITSYAPLGQRQVLMRPVVVQSPVVAAAPVISSACSACEVAAPCSACAPVTSAVQSATYAAPAAAPCTGCAQGSTITYADQAPTTYSGSTQTPQYSGQTPQPQLTPQEAAPLRSNYPDVTPPQNNGAQNNNGSQNNGQNTAPRQQDPGPAADDKAADSSSYFEAPALFIPGDRTAQEPPFKRANRAPSVDVWTAVYHAPADADHADNISTTSFKPATRTQAEIDAEGWSSVPAN